MRATHSTPRKPGRARVARHLRGTRIEAAVGAILAITNPMANARMRNQINNPMVFAMAGAGAEAVNNISTGITNLEEGETELPEELEQLIRLPNSFA